MAYHRLSLLIFAVFVACSSAASAQAEEKYNLPLRKLEADVPTAEKLDGPKTAANAGSVDTRLQNLEKQIELLNKRVKQLEEFQKSSTGVHLLSK